MSTTQISLKIINAFIRNEFLILFKNHKNLYKLYLESCYKKCNHDKQMWLRGFITTVTKQFNKHILYERFYGNFHKKYPNYAIDETHYNDISYFIADCINNDDDHEYHDFDFDDDDDDQLIYEYIDDYILEHYNVNDEYDTQYILFTYFNHYLTYKLDCIIFRIDDMITKNIIKKTQIRDAKLATIVLNKIPNLNYDVISHIAKYICRDIKI